jgi:hypothetical protein
MRNGRSLPAIDIIKDILSLSLCVHQVEIFIYPSDQMIFEATFYYLM